MRTAIVIVLASILIGCVFILLSWSRSQDPRIDRVEKGGKSNPPESSVPETQPPVLRTGVDGIVPSIEKGVCEQDQIVDQPVISDETAEAICRKSLEESFPNRLFKRVEIKRGSGIVSVVLRDVSQPSDADSFTVYHFSVDASTASIIDDAIEIVENR